MKQKRTKPKPIPPKHIREAKVDWEAWEHADWVADCERREKKRLGPSPEAQKLLNKKVKK